MLNDLKRPERLLELVGLLYEAVRRDDLWPDLAPRIAAAFGAAEAAIFGMIEGAPSFISRTPNIDAAWAADYPAYYRRAQSDGGDGSSAHRSGRVTGGAPDASVAAPTTFSWANWRQADGSHGIGGIIPVAPRETMVFGLHRRCGMPEFDELDRMRFPLFLSHLQRALQFRKDLGRGGIIAIAARNRLDHSITANLIADRAGQILYANPAAATLLSEGDGIQIASGRLTAVSRSATDRLISLVAAAIDGIGGTMSIQRESKLPLTVLVTPLGDSKCGGVPSAVVSVRAPEAYRVDPEPLQSLFGLTRAEAEIAGDLVTGKTLGEIAASHRISLHTARAHLRSVFAKTGTSRQAQFVAMVMSSVAGLASWAIPYMGDVAPLSGL